MWIIRWVVLLLIIVIVLTFSLQNQGQVVSIRMMNWHSGDIPLYLALFISFGFGMVAFLLIAVFQQLQTLADLSKEKRGRKRAESEAAELATRLEALESEIAQNDRQIAQLRRETEELRSQTPADSPMKDASNDQNEE